MTDFEIISIILMVLALVTTLVIEYIKNNRPSYQLAVIFLTILGATVYRYYLVLILYYIKIFLSTYKK